MSNSTSIQNKLPLSVRLTLVVPSVVFLCVFLYFITVITRVYWNTPHVRETSRYILFFHMLMYDTLYLLLGFLLMMASQLSLTMLVSICYILVTIGETTYLITPYILATMALERYSSVCFPLRHVELCTAQRSNVTVAVLWMVSLALRAVDFILLAKSVNRDFFGHYVVCNRYVLIVDPVQGLVGISKTVLSLALVGLVIIYTYIRILMVALKIGSGKSSALKASKTVLLHAFQLLFYIISLTSPIVEDHFDEFKLVIQYIAFLVFMCFPRFLGPLIYGLRDEAFRKCIQKTLGIGLYNKRL
ncbi:odorant receptor 131-2-like [Rana temporaria]|uniref:odorant receptor 131-2-like n=1 Tax=Rana temporaria TaxID=8407 RepID=UPI001AADDD62|nr:odorant receptor 131-2-like [Rana temporaria]